MWESNLTKVLFAYSSIHGNEVKSLTTFELWTIAAFLCFRDASVKIAVIEVGVGGRDDATNVIPTPLVAIITSISMDHVEILGPSIADIASHKSGIIKDSSLDNAPAIVVTSPDQNDDVLNVIKQRSSQVGAKLIIAQSLARNKISSHTENEAEASIYDSVSEIRSDGVDFKVPLVLLGDFQRSNGGTALAALRELQKRFPELTDEDIITGFSRVTWSGRMQRIMISPPSSFLSSTSKQILSPITPLEFILDGGHNEGAIPLVRAAIDELISSSPLSKRVQFIFSSGASRSLTALLPHLLRPGDSLLAVPFSSPEGMGWVKAHSPDTIVTTVKKLFGNDDNKSSSVEATACSTLEEALETIFHEAFGESKECSASDVVLRVICGSLYLVSDVIRREEECQNQNKKLIHD